MSRPLRTPARRSSLSVSDDALIDVILSHEGSTFTNDPNDSGGPTKYGITQAVLSAWRQHECTITDVKNLTRDEAAAIYRAQYIRPFDMVAEPLRINVVDFGVNAGVRRATIALQEMVGATVDAWIGAETLKAISSRTAADWNVLYVGFRLAFYEELIRAKPKNQKWRGGWRNRAFSFLPDVTRTARRLMKPTAHMGKAA